jgi:PhnB protein
MLSDAGLPRRPWDETPDLGAGPRTQGDEVAIGTLLEAQAQAIRTKNADAVLSSYAFELVLYDLAPPLARRGAEARDRNNLIAWFDTWQGPIRYDMKDVAITVSGDIAFAHGFVCIGGTKTDGQAADVWTRQPVCLRKRSHGWTIVHEHTSTPFYMDSSLKAAVDLAP